MYVPSPHFFLVRKPADDRGQDTRLNARSQSRGKSLRRDSSPAVQPGLSGKNLTLTERSPALSRTIWTLNLGQNQTQTHRSADRIIHNSNNSQSTAREKIRRSRTSSCIFLGMGLMCVSVSGFLSRRRNELSFLTFLFTFIINPGSSLLLF